MTRPIVPITELRQAETHVVNAFLRDCEQRSTAAEFPSGIYASGHYFDEPARNQRGLHGTAAALRVLGSASSHGNAEARTTTAGIARYLADRENIELTRAARVNEIRKQGGGGKDEVAYWEDKLRHDQLNTSKQADLLYALNFVKLNFVEPEVAPTPALKAASTALLDNGRALDGFGWGWTLDKPPTSDELATAYVVRALTPTGRPVDQETEWLRTRLTERHEATPERRVLEGDCLILQVLWEAGAIDENQARTILDKLWRNLAVSLEQPRTLRRRFAESGPDHYVLIHWQLHLVALCAALRPFRYYLSTQVQLHLSSSVDAVGKRESLNPSHDEDSASTRHYGYFYDTIEQCISGRPRTGLPDRSVAWFVDLALNIQRIGLGMAWVGLAAISIAFLVAVLYSWVTGGGWLGDLGPELTGTALLALAAVLWRYMRSRRE